MPATTRRRAANTASGSPPAPKPLQFQLDGPTHSFYRADLEFHGVDHSGASLEARVFVNNGGATASTELDPAQGYADSFYIFGHGGCFGEQGHCEVPSGPQRAYDLRPPHQLTPIDVRVVATDAIRAAMQGAASGKLTVTVVPVIEPEDAADYTNKDLLVAPLNIQDVALITYA